MLPPTAFLLVILLVASSLAATAARPAPAGPLHGAGKSPAASPDGTALGRSPAADSRMNLRPAGSSALAIRSFTISPATVVVASATNVTVNITGGTPPITFAYRNLPFGCSSENKSAFPCSPSSTGTYVVDVQVTDAVGEVATSSANLTVTTGRGSPPLITEFVAEPATVAEDHPTVLHVVAESQSSTPTFSLSYFFFDLPPGCAGFNQTDLTCVPQAPGAFMVRVQVSDGFGSFTYASTNLTVTGSPAASSSGGSWFQGPVLYLSLIAVASVAALGAVAAYRRAGRRRPPGGTAATTSEDVSRPAHAPTESQ